MLINNGSHTSSDSNRHFFFFNKSSLYNNLNIMNHLIWTFNFRRRSFWHSIYIIALVVDEHVGVTYWRLGWSVDSKHCNFEYWKIILWNVFKYKLKRGQLVRMEQSLMIKKFNQRKIKIGHLYKSSVKINYIVGSFSLDGLFNQNKLMMILW